MQRIRGKEYIQYICLEIQGGSMLKCYPYSSLVTVPIGKYYFLFNSSIFFKFSVLLLLLLVYINFIRKYQCKMRIIFFIIFQLTKWIRHLNFISIPSIKSSLLHYWVLKQWYDIISCKELSNNVSLMKVKK